MFLVNVKKCLKIFDKVYVSSDSLKILKQAEEVGAIGILRGEELCGDVPNIPVYQHAWKHMHDPKKIEGIVAVQANSPTIDSSIIKTIKRMMQEGKEEVMTCDEDKKIYGSVWAIATKKLKVYGDPYKPMPDLLIVDPSVDIHDILDYNKALNQ